MILEAVGVPKNIVNISRRLYEVYFYSLGKYDDIEDFLNDRVVFSESVNISDFNIRRIIINTEFGSHPKLVYAGMTFHSPSHELTNNHKIHYGKKHDRIELSIQFAGPEGTTLDELIDYVGEKRVELTEGLSHELKHAYDTYKNPTESSEQRSEYMTLQSQNFSNISPLNRLMFHLYFIHNIENLVRPTEFATSLSELNIDKKQFYNFITNHRTYEILREIKNMSYGKLKESLKLQIDNIKTLMSSLGLDTNKSDEELIEKILELFYINMVNWNVDSMQRILFTGENFMSQFFGELSPEKYETLEKYAKKLRRYSENYQDYFETMLRKNSEVAIKMMKKVSKVYSLIKDKELTNESIIDWELWHKIKGTDTKIVTEFTYTSDSRSKNLK